MNSKQLTLDDYFALKNSFETLEVFHDDSHKELKLKSRDGKLYLYEFMSMLITTMATIRFMKLL